MDKTDKLLELLNEAWASLKPIKLYDFDKRFFSSDETISNLAEAFFINRKIPWPPDLPGSAGVHSCNDWDYKEVSFISVLSLISTITKALCDKKLIPVADENGYLVHWEWNRGE
jgi:hypothetical protein